jgi:hypothetical protein
MVGPRLRFLAGTVISAALALAVLTPAAALAGPPPARAPFGEATAGACVPGANILCLNNARFAVSVEWKDFSGNTGSGKAIPLTADTGYFWFFTNTNVELVVKVLDARGLNGHFWVFYGALSNVEYTMTVTDTATSAQKIYSNPSGTFASAGDTLAFAASVGSTSAAASDPLEAGGSTELGSSSADVIPVASTKAQRTGCVADATGLCLAGGRFRVEVNWKDFQGKTGRGQAIGLTADTGYFWFFNSANVELVVKALDARGVNGKFWAFYGALSNVEYEVVVIDTETGESRRYKNPSGNFASAGDTAAFPLAPGTPIEAITAVGTPDGEPATGSIGPAGGSLTSKDGVATLTVPPNALTSTVAFTITPITNEAPGGYGNAYQFEPEGQTFAIPAEISFSSDLDVTGSFEAGSGVAYQDDQHFWRVVKPAAAVQAVTKALAGNKKKGSVSKLKFHYVVFSGYWIKPPNQKVRMGGSANVRLVFCSENLGTAEGDEIVLTCSETLPGDVEVLKWKTFDPPRSGTVTPTGRNTAKYQAPTTYPSCCDYLLAQLVRGSDRGAATATVRLIKDQWKGTTHSNLLNEVTGTTQLTWTLLSSENNVSKYQSSGTATMEVWKGCAVEPNHGEVGPSGLLYVDFSHDPPTYTGTAKAAWPAHFSCKDSDLPFDGPAEIISFDAVGSVSSEGYIEGGPTPASQSLNIGWVIDWHLTSDESK